MWGCVWRERWGWVCVWVMWGWGVGVCVEGEVGLGMCVGNVGVGCGGVCGGRGGAGYVCG